MTPIALALASAILNTSGEPQFSRWGMDADGGITWSVEGKPHSDHIEMSGRRVAVIVRYGVDDSGALLLDRHIVWPGLRTIPNDTHASFSDDFGIGVFPKITVDGRPITRETPTSFTIRGMLRIESSTDRSVTIRRTIFPSTRNAAVIEDCEIVNTSNKLVIVRIEPLSEVRRTDPAKGVDGEYTVEAKCARYGVCCLKAGENVRFSIVFSARQSTAEPLQIDASAEEKARETRVNELWSELRFECPDPVLSRQFDFCKLRAAESIFETKGGLMHAPGGGPYYAAIWANDEAEYANPFFPFLGDRTADESAVNAYRLFARYMNPEYRPIPSSIIAEGIDTWHGAGDRGDAAMIAYGASRFALARGDKAIAQELWPLVEWCLEYCRRKTNAEGVIASDSDELEGRFPAGDANLSTSSLAYDALRSAALLARDLGKPSGVSDEYKRRAEALRAAIEKHFGSSVGGYETYRYYAGNTVLRAWVCVPLAMGILDRKDGTIAALFSPKLWTDDGLATESGQPTFWDRSTLYALRGVFIAGETERALSYLTYYSNRRLLGEHVPYPIEAWPEGNQRHLSAESALYCRVITEGLFGIRPMGLRSFSITPRLPKQWKEMTLRNIRAFGNDFDVHVSSDGVPAVTCRGVKADVTPGDEAGQWIVKFPEL